MTPADSAANTAGTAVRPPRLYLGALLVGIGLDYVLPLTSAFPLWLRLVGLLPLVAGAALLAWGIRCFSAAGTNVPTVLPTTALVTAGPYRFSRNPIYIGLTAMYVGLALLAASVWALLLVVPVLLVMEFGVIRREERYLETRFGDAYRDYRQGVRRWL